MEEIISKFVKGSIKVGCLEIIERDISYGGFESTGLFMKNGQTGKEVLISYSEEGYPWTVYPSDFKWGIKQLLGPEA